MNWNDIDTSERRREVHYDGRILSCLIDRPGGLWAMISDAAARNGRGEALVCGQRRWTWDHLVRDAASLSAWLSSRGIEAGDRVALLVGNRAEFVISLYAILRLGAVAVPLSTRYQTPEIAYALQDCGARLLIHDGELAERLPALAPRVSALTVGADDWDVALASRHESAGAVEGGLSVAEDDAAVILYTSGTTGRPKGAMLTHLGLVNSSLVFRHCFELGEADRTLAAVPLAHVTGLVANLLTMAACAGTVVVLPAFKAQHFLALAAAERTTHTIIVPAMYSLCMMVPDIDGYDLSAWRIGGFGGAPMPESLIDEIASRLPGLRLLNAYGATETSSPSTIMPAHMTASRLASVGLPVPGCEILVMGEDGREVAPGVPGELWIGGPSVVKGYWNKPDADADSFVGGFWRSGDIGTMDADGFVYVLDRKKDMINRGGLKIFSAEVENILMAHPSVAECAVVGTPCPVLGERVHAFVVAREAVAEADLRSFLERQLSNYKVPETFSIAFDPLPRNSNGKILKRELKEMLRRASPSDAARET